MSCLGSGSVCKNVCFHMGRLCWHRTISPLVLDSQYLALKNNVIRSERRVLKELGFCVHVKHPHKVSCCCWRFVPSQNKTTVRTIKCPSLWIIFQAAFRFNK